METFFELLFTTLSRGIFCYVGVLIISILERLAKVKDPVQPSYWIAMSVGLVIATIKVL